MFGRLLYSINGWSYRIEDDVDPDDKTWKYHHLLVNPNGRKYWDFNELCSPYEIADESLIQDFISYKEFGYRLTDGQTIEVYNQKEFQQC